jgi:hypothetical protein
MGCGLFEVGEQVKHPNCPSASIDIYTDRLKQENVRKSRKTRKLEQNQLQSEKQGKVNAIQWDVVCSKWGNK